MPRILVADDDALQLDLRKMVLETPVTRWMSRSRWAERCAAWNADPTDLVIMDLRFPNPSGEPDSGRRHGADSRAFANWAASFR